MEGEHRKRKGLQRDDIKRGREEGKIKGEEGRAVKTSQK